MAIYNGGLNIIAPDISGKEDKSNKVTAWSSPATDTNYPSEKLVKSTLNKKVDAADVISIEEIKASTDEGLAGKLPNARALVNKCSCETFGFVDNDTITITLPRSFNILLYISTYRTCGLYVVRWETSGNVFVLPIKEAESITVTSGAAGTSQMIINNSNAVGGTATIVYD